MKNTDKITLTVGQLKKLVKESNDVIDNIFDQMEILDELSDTAIDAIASAKDIIRLSRTTDDDIDYSQYEGRLHHILNLIDQVKKFDVFAFE